MQTIKTALLIVFMMVILYGAYVILYTPEPPPLQGISDLFHQDPTPPTDATDSEATGDSEDPLGPVVLTLDSDPAEGITLETPAFVDQPIGIPEGSISISDSVAGGVRLEGNPPEQTIPATVAVGDGGLTGAVVNPDVTRESASLGAAIPDDMDPDEMFRLDWDLANQQAKQGDPRACLETLSQHYDNHQIDPTFRAQLLDTLDRLAGQVIYSQRHLLEPPLRVQATDSLAMIAHQYRVPMRLLQNINGIQDPGLLVPGSELKVVKGPFRALVDLSDEEVALFLGPLYAGRFACKVGSDPPPPPGQYTVLAKQQNRSYYVGDGSIIAGGDPSNPYGHVWLDLGNQICLHGTPQDPAVSGSTRGCIRLSRLHGNDVYGILSAESQVAIRR